MNISKIWIDLDLTLDAWHYIYVILLWNQSTVYIRTNQGILK